MNFDYTSRFQAAFGFLPTSAESNSSAAVGIYVDKMGNFDDVKFYNGKLEYNFSSEPINEDYSGFFAFPPMITPKRAKRLIETTIDNTDFEVVERYSTQPWDLELRGVIIDMVDHNFPVDSMVQLHELFELNDIWNVSSVILNKLKIDAVYIKDISLEFVEGFEDTISYTINARQIKGIKFQINK